MHWRKYKDIVARANVVYWEVVVEITRTSRSQEPVGIVDEVPFRIENITQESTIVEDVPNLTCPSEFVADSDMAVACDHFDSGTFEEEDERGAGEDDDVSLGSEDNEYDSSDDEDDDEGTGKKNRRVTLGCPKQSRKMMMATDPALVMRK